MDAATERGYNVPLVLLVTAFGLPGPGARRQPVGFGDQRGGQAAGSARVVVARSSAQSRLDRLDRLDAATYPGVWR